MARCAPHRRYSNRHARTDLADILDLSFNLYFFLNPVTMHVYCNNEEFIFAFSQFFQFEG